MIVYQATKEKFKNDVITNNIENVILDIFKKKLGRTTGKQEILSWRNSMMYMENVLQDTEIPNDCGVMIEYQIPQTSKRIDFILTGKNENDENYALIVELKQWERVQMTEKDGVVETFIGKAMRETPHPSYQAWSYAALLEGFNEAVYIGGIKIKPCAYLHNCVDGASLQNDFYSGYISKAPLFLRPDVFKLREFIKQFVKKGD